MDRVLDALQSQLSPGADCCVAFSGGLDSTVLLNALVRLRSVTGDLRLRAFHINHQLHGSADNWVENCRTVCRSLDVPLTVEPIVVDDVSALGPEGAARRARYAAFKRGLKAGEILLTAHHRDDQLETVLMRLLRGAGVHGLGGIPARARFGQGWLLRPLLDLSRHELHSAAQRSGLHWIEDSSNADTALDRNLLRQRIVPELATRWPALGQTVARTARLCAEAATLLDDLAAEDAKNLLQGQVLELPGLRELTPRRQRNLLRFAIKSTGIRPPTESQLRVGLEQLLTARVDGRPLLRWSDGELRRYRERLYILGMDAQQIAFGGASEIAWDGRGVLSLGPCRGFLRLERTREGGIDATRLGQSVQVRFRVGGESVLQADQKHHKRLKNIFQEAGIVPWMRAHVPLLYAAGELHAVADLCVAGGSAAAAGEAGLKVVWQGHAPLH
jgi:tRNA(Ile)-lysidine synthase